MKQVLFTLLTLLFVITSVQAVELPRELEDAVPKEAEIFLEGIDPAETNSLTEGLVHLLDKLNLEIGGVIHQRMKGAVQILLIVLLCAAVEGGTGEGKATIFLPIVGGLSISAVTAGSLDSLLGMGAETIADLARFSKVLMPVLAAAVAASGGISAATAQQIATVFFIDLLMALSSKLLLPLIYLYIALLTAGACLADNRLNILAEGLKKMITWMLCGSLLLFTAYLSAVHAISGSADASAVKAAKAAISSVVPVVGGIISEAAETVLAGAGALRGAVGVFGMLAVLGACAYPFLQLGVQYLLYKLTAFLTSVVGAPRLCSLINGLGGAFGLVLGMTGSCALLLLISILSCVSVVIP